MEVLLTVSNVRGFYEDSKWKETLCLHDRRVYGIDNCAKVSENGAKIRL